MSFGGLLQEWGGDKDQLSMHTTYIQASNAKGSVQMQTSLWPRETRSAITGPIKAPVQPLVEAQVARELYAFLHNIRYTCV